MPTLQYYINVYRTGGFLNAKWHECLPIEGLKDATDQAESIRRMGYYTLTKTLADHQRLGVPTDRDWETLM